MTLQDLRPVQHLIQAMRLYPSTGRMVDEMKAGRGTDLPEWPEWCFLPMAGWYSVVCQDNGGRQRLPPALVADVGRLAAIGTWRYSQGIYRIDGDMREALENSTVSGKIPADVLKRLPEWSLYVETPGDLEGWLAACLKRLKFRGELAVVHRADQVGQLLAALSGKVGDIRVVPFWPRPGLSARRIVVSGRKGAGGAAEITPGICVHPPAGSSYAPAARKILRDGSSLDQALFPSGESR